MMKIHVIKSWYIWFVSNFMKNNCKIVNVRDLKDFNDKSFLIEEKESENRSI